jgi:hypothetical protein
MRTLRFTALAAAVLIVSSTPARAQGFITPFLGFNFGGDSGASCVSLTNCEDKRLNWGVGLGTTHGILGFEEEIAYAKNFFGETPGGDNSVLTVMSNLLVVVPTGPVRPYGLFGIGLIRPHFTTSNLSLDQNTLGYDIGGGVNLFFSRNVGLRGDVRHLHTLQDVTLGVFNNDKIDFWRGSAGLTFRF